MENIFFKMTNVSGNKGKFRLEDINLEMEPGFIYGLMGENGAGKTTLMKYIVEDQCLYSGEILLNGIDLHDNHATIMHQIGYVSEDREFFNHVSVRNQAELLGGFYDHFDIDFFEEMMKKMEVSSAKKYEVLSRGEKLKFQLAFEMAHHPKLYLLDEVTAGMDPVFRKELFGVLHKMIETEDTTILMTSHIESEMRKHVDYVGIMKEGRFGGFQEGIEING